MQIFIHHHGQQTGPFPINHVRSGLASGTYQPTDLAWHEGAAGWLPLSAIAGISGQEPPAAPQTSGLAISSLVLGILSFFTLGLAGIPAVVCGHLALRKIKRSPGTQTGGGLALAGLICGYIGFVLVGLLMVGLVAGVTAPLVIRQRKKADQTEAVSHARQVALALFEFEAEYGSIPNDATAEAVSKATNTGKVTGTSSNARFRQLIRSGILPSEKPFYAKTARTHQPDENTAGPHCLEAGECGFAYVESSSTLAGPRRPLAMTPLIPGTDRFDPQPFDGKAVIVWTDNSVTSLPIDRTSGHVMVDGKNLLDATHPVWDGKPPVILLPE